MQQMIDDLGRLRDHATRYEVRQVSYAILWGYKTGRLNQAIEQYLVNTPIIDVVLSLAETYENPQQIVNALNKMEANNAS